MGILAERYAMDISGGDGVLRDCILSIHKYVIFGYNKIIKNEEDGAC